MERTGGEPDVVGYNEATGETLFADCAPGSPKGRRSVCYDPKALVSRKQRKPKDSAVGMAEAMDYELLSEQHYRALQELGDFDTGTSSLASRRRPAPSVVRKAPSSFKYRQAGPGRLSLHRQDSWILSMRAEHIAPRAVSPRRWGEGRVSYPGGCCGGLALLIEQGDAPLGRDMPDAMRAVAVD